MKIRSGFVSNSSSSSFLIYGVYADNSEIKKALARAKVEVDEDSDYVADELYNLVKDDSDVQTHSPDYSDGAYVGASWSRVKDNETGAEFKARIEAELKGIFGDDVKVGTHAESWYS